MGKASIDPKELWELCRVDMNLYNLTFFPETFRKKSPSYHKKIYNLLDSDNRHVAIKVFRGGAKTTILRAFASKRIAYGISNTILFISSSEPHSVSSIRWIKKQVEHNKRWAKFFGLRKGNKWKDEFCQIQRADGSTVTLIPKGVTGQIRGVNIEDYRPDLIVIDDVDTEETAATEGQRQKQSDLVFGSALKSLAARQDVPQAKMVVLGTPLNEEDIVDTCFKDPSFETLSVSCFTDSGESSWPSMFTTKELYKDKEAHVTRGQASLWLREMECILVGRENADFKKEWLQFYDLPPSRHEMAVFMGVDPVPPPSEAQIANNLKTKDYEVLFVIGFQKGDFYILEYSRNRGHTPDWTVNEFFRLLDIWNPIRVRVEGVAYQRTLKWLLEKEMLRRNRFVQINSDPDRRKKRQRIVQNFSGIGSQRRLFLSKGMTEFVTEWVTYPNAAHDDILDAGAMAMDEALSYSVNDFLEHIEEGYDIDLTAYQSAP